MGAKSTFKRAVCQPRLEERDLNPAPKTRCPAAGTGIQQQQQQQGQHTETPFCRSDYSKQWCDGDLQVAENAYLNVSRNTIAAGSQLSLAEYQSITLMQLEQLWSRYGKIGEIWFGECCKLPPPSWRISGVYSVSGNSLLTPSLPHPLSLPRGCFALCPFADGGTPDGFGTQILKLFNRLQQGAVMFQGPGPNAVRWAGTEGGVAPYDTWSTSASSMARPEHNPRPALCGAHS